VTPPRGSSDEVAIMSQSLPGAHLRLLCKPGKAADSFVFAYRLENHGSVAVLAMNAMPSVDPETGEVSANTQAAAVLHRDGGTALLGKFIAPLPEDRRILAPDLPLCFRLEPGQAVDRELRLPLPFAEASPYFPDLRLREYAPAEVTSVVLAIGYWPADMRGLYSAPAAYAPDHLVVTPTVEPVAAELAWQRFPTSRIEILRRSDAFPPVLKNHPVRS
jgi:hypothetical protein